MDISKIDKNFAVETTINEPDIKFIDVREEPFTIHGLIVPEGDDVYKRMPTEVAKSVSDGVFQLYEHTAGGRVTFRTDSRYIAINITYKSVERAPHFALTGTMGLDMYQFTDDIWKYAGTFRPPFTEKAPEGYESIIYFEDKKMREITINMPLYSSVQKLYVGLDKNCAIEKFNPYRNIAPIVYYGSSITQGGCASRPGTCYQSIISRRLNVDYINLGFSGNALAENEIADYIKKLDMSVFVYDYDHNATNAEFLEKTHMRMFKRIREERPDLPIIMVSAPKYDPDAVWRERKAIIKRNYEEAKASGDNNVYFLDGHEILLPNARYEATVDGSHPNDVGFACMAEHIGNQLEEILGL